jgi:hypothetical protein
MRRISLVVLLYICAGCHFSDKKAKDTTNIHLSKDSQMVVLGGLEYAALQELKKDSLTLAGFQDLFPVYKMPADTDLKDYLKAQRGTYQITDSLITFKPDTVFAKHQAYFARFYGYTTDNSATRLAQGKANLNGPKFKEVVFKF